MSNAAEVLIRPGVVFPEPDDDAARGWLSAVYEVARMWGESVVGDLHGLATARNFYSVPISFEGATVTLLFNPAARLVAAVEGDRPHPPNAVFTSVPGSDVFIHAGLRVAHASTLEAPLHESTLDSLRTDEAAQVRYHRPQRLGDLLFNWFD